MLHYVVNSGLDLQLILSDLQEYVMGTDELEISNNLDQYLKEVGLKGNWKADLGIEGKMKILIKIKLSLYDRIRINDQDQCHEICAALVDCDKRKAQLLSGADIYFWNEQMEILAPTKEDWTRSPGSVPKLMKQEPGWKGNEIGIAGLSRPEIAKWDCFWTEKGKIFSYDEIILPGYLKMLETNESGYELVSKITELVNEKASRIIIKRQKRVNLISDIISADGHKMFSGKLIYNLLDTCDLLPVKFDMIALRNTALLLMSQCSEVEA